MPWLSDRVKKRLPIDQQYLLEEVTIHRTHAGHWQRSGGAWSWWADRGRTEMCGSIYPLTDLAKGECYAEANTWGQIEIWPRQDHTINQEQQR